MQRNRGGGCSGGRDPLTERPKPTPVFALSVLVLSSLINNVVAFRNVRVCTHTSEHRFTLVTVLDSRGSHLRQSPHFETVRTARDDPLRKREFPLTSLSYKNNVKSALLPGSPKGDVSSQPTARRRGRLSKKNYIARKGRGRKTAGLRSYRSVPVTEEELMQDVHPALLELETFHGEKEEGGEEDCNDTCTLSELDNGESSSPSAVQRHTDSCRKLDRYPALVLNADYQVCTGLLLLDV